MEEEDGRPNAAGKGPPFGGWLCPPVPLEEEHGTPDAVTGDMTITNVINPGIRETWVEETMEATAVKEIDTVVTEHLIVGTDR